MSEEIERSKYLVSIAEDKEIIEPGNIVKLVIELNFPVRKRWIYSEAEMRYFLEHALRDHIVNVYEESD